MTDNTSEIRPDDDRREAVVEPQPQAGHADNIRDEQGTHAAGAVPAGYVGGEEPGPKPEDAADNSDHWDEMGRENPER